MIDLLKHTFIKEKITLKAMELLEKFDEKLGLKWTVVWKTNDGLRQRPRIDTTSIGVESVLDRTWRFGWRTGNVLEAGCKTNSRRIYDDERCTPVSVRHQCTVVKVMARNSECLVRAIRTNSRRRNAVVFYDVHCRRRKTSLLWTGGTINAAPTDSHKHSLFLPKLPYDS